MSYFNQVKITMVEFAKGKYIIISLVMLFIFVFLMRGRKGHLDERFGYSPNDAYSLMNHLGNKGRRSYFSFLWLDFGVIVFLGIILLIVIAILLNKLAVEDKWSLLFLLPIVRGIFDILENIFIMIILSNYPRRLNIVVNAASIMTQLKWVTMILSIVSIIALTVIVLIKAFMIKKAC